MLVVMNEESTSPRPTDNQVDWQTVRELLQTTPYDQGAKLLHQAQLACTQTGQTTEADILTLLGYVWLAVSQTHSEVAWHHQACTQARQREQELKQQLLAILALLDPPAPSEPQPLSTAATLTPPTALPGTLAPAPAQPGSAVLVIHCLGPFRAALNGRPITGWNSLKSQGIFKYLVTHPGVVVSKDLLMDLFWPEADPLAARRNLHQAIYCLRQTFKHCQSPVQPVQFEHDGYSFNPALTLWLDATEFERHAQAGRRWEAAGQVAAARDEYRQAEALYQGEFLAEDLYEDWPSGPRERLRQTYLDLADRLSESYLQQGDIETAIALCQKMLGRDNCFEQAHRRLMRCYYNQGQLNLAVRQYQHCIQTLKAELNMQPSMEIQLLYQKITQSTGQLALAH